MKYFLIILILLIGTTGLYFLDKSPEPSINEEPQVVVQNPDSVIKYVSENISKLSPEKEQVGGTFFVTNITLDLGTGNVEYEDGHNAYVAKFEYKYGSEEEILITNFVLVE